MMYLYGMIRRSNVPISTMLEDVQNLTLAFAAQNMKQQAPLQQLQAPTHQQLQLQQQQQLRLLQILQLLQQLRVRQLVQRLQLLQ